MPYSPIGLSKWDLDTPALLIDLDKLDRNIAEMAARCKTNGVDWRPHTKGHKNPAIAHLCVEAGAIGVTCAKLSEAEVMAAAGIDDILVANEIVGEQKVRRLAGVQRRSSVMCAVDDPFHIHQIGKAAVEAGVSVRVLVDVNTGMNRCGVLPGAPAADLAELAESTDGVTFAGIMGYEGHAMKMPDDEKQAEVERGAGLLRETIEDIQSRGIKVGIVSAGGTGTLSFTPQQEGVTEIQAGGGVLMDTVYRDVLNVPDLECALALIVTVISHATPERAIIDAGRKTMHPAVEFIDQKDIEMGGLSAEHGNLLVGPTADLKVGQKLELTSGYGDDTIFLHNQVYGIRNDRVEVVWDILGRGKLH
jgi:D-serine deaminase-like pyridoxal phosphate-dependent protein|tara:strand:- start:20121 stop:21206 length:1086 start_codon:yes stop_codon:yes gene_type:complete